MVAKMKTTMTQQCRGFRPGCTNEATHTVKGYRFCLECAREFAGYTPEPIEAPLLDRLSALLVAARAYLARLDAHDADPMHADLDDEQTLAAERELRAAVAALDERER